MCTICGNYAGDPDAHMRNYGHTPVTAGYTEDAPVEHDHQH